MKIAVVGVGKIGQRHLNIWSKLEGVEIVGVIGRNPERLKVVGNRHGARTFTSIEELLSEVEVDAFDICTPTDTHLSFVTQIAEAHKDIICAKPLGVTSEEAEEMIAICEQNNIQLLVSHTLRFFPEYANAKEQVKNGAIGRPGVIRMSRGVPYPSAGREWYSDEKRSGGLFLDVGVHEFEWIQSTFGDVHRVMAKHVKHTEANGRAMEYGLVTIRMVDGTIVHVELSWAETKFRSSFELTGDKGMITYNLDETNPVILDVHNDGTSVDWPQSMLRRDPYTRQLEHFLDCLTGKVEPVVLATDALAAIRIAEAAKKSAEEGQPVVLSEGGQKI
ncbi:Gfo/Idh/MocA family protein [Sporosarcina sp. 6E9]|uniref:Gfo/Idh/MocA family protein n=1 Tax=Sporosarcina sp. 6E9 TaxID=2819235 RepID=UPI001B305A1E